MKDVIKKYSLGRDAEYFRLVEDLLNHPQVQKMEDFIQHGQTTTLAHSLDVSYMAYAHCKKKGKDPRKAARAGLLHDFFLYDWHGDSLGKRRYIHGFLHGLIAKRNAQKHFYLSPEEEDAIACHMFPLAPPPKTRLGWLIQYCDKCCSMREALGGVRSAKWLAGPFFKWDRVK